MERISLINEVTKGGALLLILKNIDQVIDNNSFLR